MRTCVRERAVGVLRLCVAALLTLSLATWTGCGGNAGGPERYDVSGTVTFAGKPVPYGQITFDPDASKGNSGPQGYANIRDGKYDTSSSGGRGVIGGPHRLLISGFDRLSANEDDPATPLFPQYSLSLDLPKKDSTQDIDVPSGEAASP